MTTTTRVTPRRDSLAAVLAEHDRRYEYRPPLSSGHITASILLVWLMLATTFLCFGILDAALIPLALIPTAPLIGAMTWYFRALGLPKTPPTPPGMGYFVAVAAVTLLPMTVLRPLAQGTDGTVSMALACLVLSAVIIAPVHTVLMTEVRARTTQGHAEQDA